MDEQERRIAHVEALLELGRGAEAERSARQALATEPESAHVAHLLARSIWLQDRVAEAVVHARTAARLDPGEVEHLIQLAGVLLESAQPQEAHDVALRAVGLDPDNWVTHWILAGALLDIGGDLARRTAEQAAHHAVTLGPHEADAHNLFGIAVWRRDDLATAEQAFRNALAIDPAHADAQRNLAQLQLSSADLTDGVDSLSRALSMHPQDRDLHDDVGYAVGGVLVAAVTGFVLVSITLGGLLLAIDLLLRQRAFIGLVWLLAIGAHALKAFRRLPGGGWARLLPWRGVPGDVRRRWFAWGMGGLTLLVWFTPASMATPAWFVLAACSTALALLRFVAVLAGGQRPANSKDML